MRYTVWACAIYLFAFALFTLFASCAFPVRVELDRAEDGKPIPLAVAQTQPPPEAQHPAFAPVDAKPAPGFDWSMVLNVALGLAGAGGGGWALVATRAAGVLRQAVQASAQHADRMEAAKTPEEKSSLKQLSLQEQEQRGIRKVIQKIRGKA